MANKLFGPHLYWGKKGSMVMRITDHVNQNSTPQSQAVPGKNMVKNDAGAFAFQQSDFDRMRRFVTIGTEGGTYYANERDVTIESAESSLRAVQAMHRATVDYLDEALTNGRVHKLDAALYVFAQACSNGTDDERSYAMSKIPTLLRTGTQLFKFLQYLKTMRGIGGSGLQRQVSRWFTTRSVGDLENQFIKYFQREGMSFRDVLRIARPGVAKKGRPSFEYEDVADTVQARALISWAVGGADKNALYADISPKGEPEQAARLPDRLAAANTLHISDNIGTKLDLIRQHRLPREAVPTEDLKNPMVWDALLPHMPMMAMVRNLGNMTKRGVIDFNSVAEKFVVERLNNEEAIRRSNIHPFHLLYAARTYASGRGLRGSGEWKPSNRVVEALSDAFDLSIKYSEGHQITKPTLLAVDTSGSMGWSGAVVNPAEIAALMAYVFVRMESNVHIIGFDTSANNYIPITKRTTIDSIVMQARSGGGTNCAIPFDVALKAKNDFDAVVMLTDSESWAGWRHTFQMCDEYRRKRNPNCKAVEMQLAGSRAGTAQLPDDPLNLQVSGFDASAYNIVESFLRD